MAEITLGSPAEGLINPDWGIFLDSFSRLEYLILALGLCEVLEFICDVVMFNSHVQ